MIEIIDASRCTGCGICVELCPLDNLGLDTFQKEIPPCQSGCPLGVDIRSYFYRFKQGRFDEAAAVLKKYLPFPAITGRVCSHPCELECARKEVDQAVNINSLERFIGEIMLKEKVVPPQRTHAARVAIIGSGPAGLAAAYFLTEMGYATTIFEQSSQVGGMLRNGILEYRLPRNVLNSQIAYLKKMGIEFKTETTIGRDIGWAELEKEDFRAIFIAVGFQLSRELDIAGAEMDGVFWGLDFLRDINLSRKIKVRGKVAVIGGGNVAMDTALAALRLGAREVEVICLESEQIIPANRDSIEQLIGEGINIQTGWGPRQIKGNRGKITGLELVRCNSVFDSAGVFNPRFDESKTKTIDADTIIFAIGQSPDLSLLPNDIKITRTGIIETDALTLETNLAGVFAGGDIALGPSSVAEAIASGKQGAISIDRYLKGEDLKAGRNRKAQVVKNLPGDGITSKARTSTPQIPVEQRAGSFLEVKTGFDEVMAIEEVQRCMTCGSKAVIFYEDCMTCFKCELECPYQAINVHPFKEELPLAIEYPVGGK